MAAAEARAAWQRTANRCFVQEDAKRAPKLACCPSASALSKQVDAGPTSASDSQDNPNVGFLPLNRNSSYSNLTPDSKWWLQLQPTYGYQRGLTSEMETFGAGADSSTSKLSGVHLQNEVDGAEVDDYIDMNYESCVKKDVEIRKQGLKGMHSKSAQEPLVDAEESYELLEMDLDCCAVSEKINDDLESPWFEAEKLEPWWRIADRDELASLVAQRSLNPIENCDLPRPQKTHFKRDPHDHLGILPSSVDWKAKAGCLPDMTVHTRVNLSSGTACTETRNSENASHKVMNENETSKCDPSKAELLEALRHSQTRAREAEKAAKQAYEEKEHIVKLFFRQASHLFAYKQWFQLLQLENLYLQIKNTDHPISTLFPAVLPWLPHKSRKFRKSSEKAGNGKRGKRGRPRCGICKFAAAFALGFSLVSAGLLLGWTVGWMLPTF